MKGQELSNVRFAVFGCGHHDWARTYQRIPKLIDQQLEERGAQRLLPRGEGDAGGSELFETFDAWESQLWAVLPEVRIDMLLALTSIHLLLLSRNIVQLSQMPSLHLELISRA